MFFVPHMHYGNTFRFHWLEVFQGFTISFHWFELTSRSVEPQNGHQESQTR